MADSAIQVALRIRPLIGSEIDRGCQKIVDTVPNEPQIVVRGTESFTFNYVFDSDVTQEEFYNKTIRHMVPRLFQGYNVTILAYGQTGSGKTFSMGTSYTCDENMGVIPRAVNHIFETINNTPENDYRITVSFMELYQDTLYDLLANKPKEQSVLDIREDTRGIKIPSLTEEVVISAEEITKCLNRGSLGRATGATAMNAQSSRSHAILTICIHQQKRSDESSATCAKFHLVDLAGSERSKKTKAVGERFREGVNINRGLLALGNVLSALGDESQKAGSYICYRDSKLTRLLQHSLGGNSITLMIACISPADYNFDETISTLRYADRARKIKNKPVVNQDPKSAEITRLNQRVRQLQLELLERERSTSDNLQKIRDENEILKQKNRLLTEQLQTALIENTRMVERALIAENAKEQLPHKLEELNEECDETFNALNLTEDQMVICQRIHGKIEDIRQHHKQSEVEMLNLEMEALARQKAAQDRRGQSSHGEVERIQQWVGQELDVLVSTLEAERANLAAQREDLCTSRQQPSNADTLKKELDEDLDLRSVQIADLKLEIVDAEQENESENRWDHITTMIEAKCALKQLFDAIANIKRKELSATYKLEGKQEELESLKLKIIDYEDQLKTTETLYKKQLAELECHHEEKISLLLEQLLRTAGGGDATEQYAQFSYDEKELEKDTNVKRELQEWKDKCSALEEKLKNIKHVLESENKENIKKYKLTEKKENSQQITHYEDELLSEPDTSIDDIDNDSNDPDWQKTPNQHGRKYPSTVTIENRHSSAPKDIEKQQQQHIVTSEQPQRSNWNQQSRSNNAGGQTISENQMRAVESEEARSNATKTPMDIDPNYLVPLEMGWVREFIKSPSQHPNANNVYYITPNKVTCQSWQKVMKHTRNTGLTRENFTFAKRLLGAGAPREVTIAKGAKRPKENFQEKVQLPTNKYLQIASHENIPSIPENKETELTSSRKRRSRSVGHPGENDTSETLVQKEKNYLETQTEISRLKAVLSEVKNKNSRLEMSLKKANTELAIKQEEINTLKCKGDVLATQGGGADVVLSGVETLQYHTPTECFLPRG